MNNILLLQWTNRGKLFFIFKILNNFFSQKVTKDHCGKLSNSSLIQTKSNLNASPSQTNLPYNKYLFVGDDSDLNSNSRENDKWATNMEMGIEFNSPILENEADPIWVWLWLGIPCLWKIFIFTRNLSHSMLPCRQVQTLPVCLVASIFFFLYLFIFIFLTKAWIIKTYIYNLGVDFDVEKAKRRWKRAHWPHMWKYRSWITWVLSQFTKLPQLFVIVLFMVQIHWPPKVPEIIENNNNNSLNYPKKKKQYFCLN